MRTRMMKSGQDSDTGTPARILRNHRAETSRHPLQNLLHSLRRTLLRVSSLFHAGCDGGGGWKKPRVSIAVTCCNHETYIGTCLESIFSQTHREIELFVLDDGSTDQSREVIREVLKHSPFADTQSVFQENQGIVVARNNLLDRISGDFVLFVDSDNYLTDRYVELLLRKAEEKNADIVYGNLINPDTRQYVLKAREFSLEKLLWGNFIDNCSLIRVAAIGKARYDLALNRKKLEDYDFFLQLILDHGAKAVACPEASFYYRVLPESISRATSWSFYYEVYLYIVSKYFTRRKNDVLSGIHWNFDNLLKQTDRLTQLLHSAGETRSQQEEANPPIRPD